MRYLNSILLGTVAALVIGGSATAAPPIATIEGVYMAQENSFLGASMLPRPELTPAALAERKAHAEAEKKGYVRSVANMLCLPQGGPILFQYRSPFEVFEGFGRITFIYETEGSNQPRTVYMNEKTHPKDIYPSFNGHSIGHWEGDTLVVDTIGFNGRGSLPGNVPKSEKMHIVERFTWSNGGKLLTMQLTADDPVNLVKPWTTTLFFDRRPDTEERFEVWCEPDLDAFKTVDLKSLKDADPEVARLLDPTLSPADPALAIAAANVSKK